MAGVKISQLQDGGALQPTDAFPVARGSFTRKIAGSELLTPANFNVADSPTIDLDWDSTTRTLSANLLGTLGGGTVTNVTGTAPISVANGTTTPSISISNATTSAAGSMSSADKAALTVLQSNSALNVFDSPTINLDWNSSTRTLSAVTTSMVATSSSPMVAKAWVNYISVGNIYTTYNVSSIINPSAGKYKIIFNNNFSTTNYSVIALSEANSSFIWNLTKSVSAIEISFGGLGGSLYNTNFNLIVFGNI